jgi:hypothetical protein
MYSQIEAPAGLHEFTLNPSRNIFLHSVGRRIPLLELGTRMLDNVVYSYNQSVALSFMQQLSLKAALREWGDNAKTAGEKEVNQLHWQETFVPRRMSELTAEQ